MSVQWRGVAPLVVLIVGSGVQLGQQTSATASATGLGFTEDPTRLIVYGSAYLWALLWLVARSEVARRLASGLWPWLTLLGFMMLSALWSRFPLKVFVDFGHFAGVTLVTMAGAIAFNRDQRSACRLVGLATFAVLLASTIAVSIGRAGSIDLETGRWAGTAGNANTLGLIAAVCTWSVAQDVFFARGFRRLVAAAMACIAAYTILQTGSMSSLAMMTLMLMGSILGSVDRRTGNSAFVARGSAAIMTAGALVLAIYVVSPESVTTSAAFGAVDRSANFTGRTELWAVGWELFQQHPWRGFGFDSLASALYQSGSAVGQLHNGYLDLIVRGGVVALVLTLLLIVRGFAHSLRLMRMDPYFGATNAVLMGGILVHNITESSLVRNTHILWVLYMLALASVEFFKQRETLNQQESVGYDPSRDRHAHHPMPNLLR